MRDALLLLFILACSGLALRYPFAGVLAWAWFALMAPHQLAYGVYGLPLNEIIAAATLAGVAISGEWRLFRFDRTTVLLVLFAGWLCVSQVFSLDPEHSAVYFDRFIKTLIFAIVCALMAGRRLRFHALLWMLVIAIGYFAAKGGLFTLATLGRFRVQGVENTVLEDNNHLGLAMAAILPFILYLRGEAKNAAVRTCLLALFALALVAILGTHSRGALIALTVFAGFFWLRARRKFLILAGLAVVLVPAVAFMPPAWKERMQTISQAAEDPSFMGRVDAWVVNMKLAQARPLTGAGLRNSYLKEIAATVDPVRAETAKAAHSIYFEVLGGAGFVGLALYLAAIASAYMAADAIRKRAHAPPWAKRFAWFAQMSLAVFCVGGAAVSLEMWDGYLIVMALIAAVTRLAAEPTPEAAPTRAGWRAQARGAPQRKPRF